MASPRFVVFDGWYNSSSESFMKIHVSGQSQGQNHTFLKFERNSEGFSCVADEELTKKYLFFSDSPGLRAVVECSQRSFPSSRRSRILDHLFFPHPPQRWLFPRAQRGGAVQDYASNSGTHNYLNWKCQFGVGSRLGTRHLKMIHCCCIIFRSLSHTHEVQGHLDVVGLR